MLGCSAPGLPRKPSMTKHVEGIWSPCLDAGSTPASSTLKQKTTTPARGFLFLKRPEESLLSEGDLRKQKNHAKRGGCFLFSGLKLRDQQSYSRQLHLSGQIQ
jgi:hypothetical protein